MSAENLDTGTDHLLASIEDSVLTLTLNRPEARNAMSREMCNALAEQLAAAELNPDVRCVVLTGSGKGFCAGGDVKSVFLSLTISHLFFSLLDSLFNNLINILS